MQELKMNLRRKKEIFEKLLNGATVPSLTKEYGVDTGTIYTAFRMTLGRIKYKMYKGNLTVPEDRTLSQCRRNKQIWLWHVEDA